MFEICVMCVSICGLWFTSVLGGFRKVFGLIECKFLRTLRAGGMLPGRICVCVGGVWNRFVLLASFFHMLCIGALFWAGIWESFWGRIWQMNDEEFLANS